MRRSASSSGTLPSTTCWAKPSTMAVLPTPASPRRTGLFLVRRPRICIVRSISFSRPMTGSSLPWRASSVRSRPKLSRAGVFDFPARGASPGARRAAQPAASALRPFRAFHAVAEQVEHLLADLLKLQSQVHQHLGGHALLLAEQPQQDVLGAHVVMVEVPRLFHRVFDHLLGPRRLRQLAHGDHVGPALHELFHLQADLAQVDVQVLQHVGRHPAALLDQAQQDVLGADIFVIEPLGLLIGQLHDLPGAVGKSFVHETLRCSGCASHVR